MHPKGNLDLFEQVEDFDEFSCHFFLLEKAMKVFYADKD